MVEYVKLFIKTGYCINILLTQIHTHAHTHVLSQTQENAVDCTVWVVTCHKQGTVGFSHTNHCQGQLQTPQPVNSTYMRVLW
jgi:hypothetical protein